MSETIVDARGQLCPKPLIMTKKALVQLASGNEMTVLIDNETSLQNVERFLKDNRMNVSHTEKDGVYTVKVIKTNDTLTQSAAEEYCSVPHAGKKNNGSHAICFSNDLMGTGEADLGRILMKAFINTLSDTTPLPRSMVFYNRGIFLTLNDSSVATAINKLQQAGVNVLVCGTCLDFYGRKKDIATGTISNMFDILGVLTNSSHVVYP